MNTTEIQSSINTNMLKFSKLMAQFHAKGFTSVRAIAQVMAEKTNTPFYSNHRALLYMANSQKYFDLMERTLEQLKQE